MQLHRPFKRNHNEMLIQFAIPIFHFQFEFIEMKNSKCNCINAYIAKLSFDMIERIKWNQRQYLWELISNGQYKIECICLVTANLYIFFSFDHFRWNQIQHTKNVKVPILLRLWLSICLSIYECLFGVNNNAAIYKVDL